MNIPKGAVLKPIHPIGYSLKKQKPCTEVQRLVIKAPYKSHKLMGILLAHTGAIGCIVLIG